MEIETRNAFKIIVISCVREHVGSNCLLDNNGSSAIFDIVDPRIALALTLEKPRTSYR